MHTAEKQYIGTQSVQHSKVIATIHKVLHCAGSSLFLNHMVQCCGMNKNTMIQFTTILFKYHSNFKHLYSKHGLVSTRTGWPEKKLPWARIYIMSNIFVLEWTYR